MWNSGIRTLTPSEHMSLLGLSISAVYCTMSYMWPALPWYTLVGSCFFGHYVAWNHGLDALRYGASLKKSHLPTPRSCLRWREKKVQSPRFPSQYGNAFSNWQLMFPVQQSQKCMKSCIASEGIMYLMAVKCLGDTATHLQNLVPSSAVWPSPLIAWSLMTPFLVFPPCLISWNGTCNSCCMHILCKLSLMYICTFLYSRRISCLP